MFDVEFDAATGAMRIVLKVSYDFVAGDPSESGPGFRAAEFTWNDEEKEAWRQVYQRDVEALWSGQHTFKSTKEGWDAVVVNTTVDVVEDTADPHFVLSVAKYPPDAGMETSSICPPGTHHDGNGYCPPNTADHHGHAHNTGTASLDSNDMREEAKLGSSHSSSWVFFKKGKADLDSAAKGVIKPVADQLNADASMKVKLTGNASNDHRSGVTPQQGAIDNMDIARERSANVAAELTGQGVSNARMIVRNVGEEGHDDNDTWCSVGVRPIDKETQNPALHETGHMFGLGDEYPATDDAGNAVLANPLYAQMVLDQTGEVVDRSARSESVMSAGSTVQGAHYASFLEALKTITGSQEWSL
jgi:outer membrane protein OmpA-like peptidoglycan-associated protein